MTDDGKQAMADVLALLDLEPAGPNIFRGLSPAGRVMRVFGGQVLGQALVAAMRTTEASRICHSLHAYFLRPGDPRVPILYEVDRSRDGHSFSVRRVVAIQHGLQIFVLSASFQTPEQGFEHQFPMPDVPPPEALEDEVEARRKNPTLMPELLREWLARARPFRNAAGDPGSAGGPAAAPALRQCLVSRRRPSARAAHPGAAGLCLGCVPAFDLSAAARQKHFLEFAGRQHRSRHVVSPPVPL